MSNMPTIAPWLQRAAMKQQGRAELYAPPLTAEQLSKDRGELYCALWECLNAMGSWGAQEDSIPEEYAELYERALVVMVATSSEGTRAHFENRLARWKERATE